MSSVIEDAGKDVAKSIFDQLKEWYSYIENYDHNIEALEKKHRELSGLKGTINEQVKRESDNLRKITEVTEGWLDNVEKLMKEEKLKQLLDKENRKVKHQCCFGRMQCNLYKRYDMSKTAERIAKEIEDEIKAKPDASMYTDPLSLSDLKSAPGEFLGSLQYRVLLVEKVLKKLEHDAVDVVGIFGMGGIGKTTLVKEIFNKAKNKFDNPVMVEISEAPNIERIQLQIAEPLRLNLDDARSVEQRAIKLYNRLIGRDEKELIILDNIWEKLDLAEVGIPQQMEFGGKLIVTSRKKDVCKVMGVEDTNIFEVHPSGYSVELMEKIIKKLEDDDVYIVGIFDMGDKGKTTLVEEISNRVEKKFVKQVMVEISEAPNMERIQLQIAKQLDLNMTDAHSVEQRAEKLYNRLGKKRKLVILDNIWEKLDLAKVGIPQQRDPEFGGKLMVTSRKKDVCKVMGVEDTNIFEVQPLRQEEARLLFRARVGKTVEKEHEEVENRILKKCGGLPLSIVAIADVLKDQDLSTWEHYASELEKPSSMHGSIKDANRLTNSILGASYRLIESEEKRRFFLLACLFPFGSSIPVEDMMRYGMGKGLFQDVNNLSEAIEQANTWADELKSSSLLLEDDYYREGVVKIQDVVRASTIELAKQDGEMFMVEAFPRWMDLKTCKKYTAISLMSGTDHSRLSGLKSHKLQILMLDNTKPLEFDDTFCQHMKNLKVLVLSRMNNCYDFLVPNSIHHRWKSSLRTLHLEHCELAAMGGIGELVNLVVLSLRYSSVEELPAEAMGNLVNLRLLDLGFCRIRAQGIPANVLARLSQLEGLYLLGSNIFMWARRVQESGGIERGSTSSIQHADDEETSINDKYASIDELNKLSYLNVLEMDVVLEDLPIQGDQFVNNLDRFYVHMRKEMLESREDTRSRSMFLGDLDMWSVRIINCAKALLLKTEVLHLFSVVGFEQYLHQEKELIRWGTKDLRIGTCNKELLESIKWSAFPNLETLILQDLKNSSIEGHSAGDEAQVGGRAATLGTANNTSIFANLRELTIYSLKKLEPYVLPIHLLPLNHLTSLGVSYCYKLKYIFGKAKKETYQNMDPPPLKLPLLKKLDLVGLSKLEGMVEVANLLEDEAPPAFFTRKLIFGALEEVRLDSLDKIVRVWDVAYWKDNADYRSAFLNLEELIIENCGKLKTLCPLSVAVALVHLKTLKIDSCREMTEAVKDDDKESDGHGHSVRPFPSLEYLKLYRCLKMGQFISAKQSYEFPSLQSLYILICDEMQSMSAGPTFRAPNLTTFNYDDVKQSIPEGGEINEFLKARYQRTQSERVSEGDIGQQS